MELWHHVVLFLSHTYDAVAHAFMYAWFWVKHYIDGHPDQILLIATIVAFLEALPVIGTIFPGSVTMTLVGIFAGRGLVSIGETVLWTTVGALVGDWLGYAFGRFFADKIPHYWPFKNRPNWLASGRRFFAKHGGKSVILGRFVGPARSTVPMIAGVFGMAAGRFAVAVFFAALFWSVAYLLPGVLIGAVSLQLTPKETTLFLVTGLLVVICLWFLFWLIQRSFQWLRLLSHRVLTRCWAGLLNCSGVNRVANWFAIPGDRLNPSPLERSVWLLLCLLIFCFLLACVVSHNRIAAMDVPAFYLFQSLRNPSLDAFFSAITLTGAPKAMLVLMVVLAIWYGVQRDWQRLLFWLLGMCAVVGVVVLLKTCLHEQRPIGFNYISSSNGFPSGHVAISTVAFGLLAYWTTVPMRMGWRSTWRIVAVIWIVLIGFSRLYLGPHWLWDVVAGWSLGGAIWLAITLLDRRTQWGSRIRFKRFSAVVVLLLFVVVSGGYAWKYFHRELDHTTPLWERRSLTLSQWLESPHYHIPQFLNNRLGRPYLPMNIQWVGNIACIRKQLSEMGWRKAAPAWDVANIIKRLTVQQAENQLPMFKRRFEGKLPDIAFIKSAKNRKNILELYLWTSVVRIQGMDVPVFVGFINQRNASHLFRHPSWAKAIRYQDGELANVLLHDLAPYYRYKKTTNPLVSVDHQVHGWSGDTWLIYPVQTNSEGSRLCS